MDDTFKTLKSLMLVFAISIFSTTAWTQHKKNKWTLQDSTDRNFDLSDFIIDAKGFVPVPYLITEPAVGGFGAALGLVFIRRRNPVTDTVGSNVAVKPLPPEITGVGVMATLNGTWGGIAFRSGNWIRAKSKYRVLGGYMDMNLSFYREHQEEEQAYAFNIITKPFSASLQRNIDQSAFSAGLSYLFLNTKVSVLSENFPEFVRDKEWQSVVSMPGVVVEVDNRDNVFSPDKGIKCHLSLNWSDTFFGSDYEFLRLTTFLVSYLQVSPQWIAAFRFDLNEVFDDAPFYLLPFVNIRGIPALRYQGNIAVVTEGEVRWDFASRWSAVAFVGAGKAYDEWDEFPDNAWRTSGGAGLRYLVARKFKLRMGVDVSRGPEQWAYYIVFGHAWLR